METSSPGGHASHLGEDQDTSPSKLSKEELIQSMDRVDREIAKVEQQIFKLKKKQVGVVGGGGIHLLNKTLLNITLLTFIVWSLSYQDKSLMECRTKSFEGCGLAC